MKKILFAASLFSLSLGAAVAQTAPMQGSTTMQGDKVKAKDKDSGAKVKANDKKAKMKANDGKVKANAKKGTIKGKGEISEELR